mmetsp:Transcript_71773/g.149896  ORF Transcript_71773/g.149896 Transcript_71773/m.149896 type:complete len:432 (-) Transcript_71773:117-1412(-)|eukprot:CAMPEP_0181297284 /NCGR_PEP_ID=MMETSP1101-20121128/5157_1 /TAXON_ID=46948 /ORGANISM="Rhodomonas abbreviata, Strain Caron Lab Isolate" /LENGTH=431 /DNA_ID=CAMNT_0023402209 /DNA_START=104 /DNA_END=1399 /DNA_ORIENTATION=+
MAFPLKSVLFAIVVVSCVYQVHGIIGIPDFTVRVEKKSMGKTAESVEVDSFVLKNKKGVEVSICTLGATITKLRVPDKAGKLDDIVLGYDTPEEYQKGSSYFGAIVGRVANRIADGCFQVDGKQYSVAKNDGGVNHLHGGNKGFDMKVWDARVVRGGVEFSLKSPDGDEGYPGSVEVAVRYTLKGDTLTVEMAAKSDAPTPVNLAQHSYFNLGGHSSGSILGHEVLLSSDKYTELKNSIPTGAVLNCTGSPFQFTSSSVIGERMQELAKSLNLDVSYDGSSHALLTLPNRTKLQPTDEGGSGSNTILGFDHNFVVRKTRNPLANLPLLRRLAGLAHVATVTEPCSGRTLTVESNAPGVQFYSGNFLNAERGKEGAVYEQHNGLCLETQHFPNSISADPSSEFGQGACPILRPRAAYRHKLRYTFGVKEESK